MPKYSAEDNLCKVWASVMPAELRDFRGQTYLVQYIRSDFDRHHPPILQGCACIEKCYKRYYCTTLHNATQQSLSPIHSPNPPFISSALIHVTAHGMVAMVANADRSGGRGLLNVVPHGGPNDCVCLPCELCTTHKPSQHACFGGNPYVWVDLAGENTGINYLATLRRCSKRRERLGGQPGLTT